MKRLNDINKKNILVFGDYMIDKYIIGKVNRISPEAPVPVINVEKEDIKLGGAGNVVNNLVSIGAKVRVLGCIGNDTAGNYITSLFSNMQVDLRFLKVYQELTTIIKTRLVSKTHQFARIDQEEKRNLPDNYYSFLQDNIDDILYRIDTIVISDYAKGAVDKKFAQLIIKAANKKSIPIIVDPKGNDYSKYSGATLCTPNMKEFNEIIKKDIETEEDIFKYGKELIKKIGLKHLIVTRSEKGLSLISNNRKTDFPAKAKEVIDVSGAGDTVVAAISILMACDFSMDEVCELSNVAASVVVSKFGTSTLTLNEWISNIDSDTNYKLLEIDTAKAIVNDLKNQGKKIVFTNGCFDLLHMGHVSSFKQAKEFGDILIVAVNTDASIKKNKGDLRPIINQKNRIDMISALEVVDYVILMDDTTPNSIIENIHPDICVKGEDWKGKQMPEKDLIESYGGKLEFIKLEKDFSTTRIIEKILKVYQNE